MKKGCPVARRPLLAANWKMHKTVGESTAFARELARRLEDWKGWADTMDLVVCPTLPALWPLDRILGRTGVGLGAQDIWPAREGAVTGAVSGYLAAHAGASWAIVGHSERRRIFAETDAMVAEKVAAARDAGLTPILCVGETLEERRANETDAVVRRQMEASGDVPGALVVAYEPVWAIGTGVVAEPREAGRVAGLIRDSLHDRWGAAADEVRVLYGGSATTSNLESFLEEEALDGALVGGASLDLAELMKMARLASGRKEDT